jgi:hypothetical protein
MFGWLLRRKPKREAIIAKIRNHFTVFGYDLDEFTDDEIETGIARAGRAAGDLGLDRKETAKLIGLLGQAFRMEQQAGGAADKAFRMVQERRADD